VNQQDVAARRFERRGGATDRRQRECRLSAAAPALQFGRGRARRLHRKIKNSPRAPKRSDCFHPQYAPNLGSQTERHDKGIVRRTTVPINANAASLASGTELFCRIAGNNHRLRRKNSTLSSLKSLYVAPHKQPLRNWHCLTLLSFKNTLQHIGLRGFHRHPLSTDRGWQECPP
jgi:hypothetical protein